MGDLSDVCIFPYPLSHAPTPSTPPLLLRRAIMGLCSKERLWQLSLLLLEHLKQSGLEPGKFVWDEICSVRLCVLTAALALILLPENPQTLGCLRTTNFNFGWVGVG